MTEHKLSLQWIKCVVVGALAVGPALPAWSQQVPSVRQKRMELHDVQRQLDLKRREIAQLHGQSQRLQQEVAQLAAQSGQSRKQLHLLQSNLAQAQRRESSLKVRLGALQSAQGNWQVFLGEEMGQFWWQTRHPDYSGTGRLWEEILRRSAILERIRYLQELHGFRERARKAEVEARQEKTRLRLRSENIHEEQRLRENLYQQKRGVYLEAQHQVAETLRAIEELENSALALTHFLQALERKSLEQPGRDIVSSEALHSLPWPVDGRVVASFGKHWVDSLKTWTFHQGIRIAASPGAPVRPVQAGKVIFAGPFRSYGQVVIVDHQGKLYTVYGMLGRVTAGKGDWLEPSAILGLADTNPDRGVVYFEMRHGSEALDPLRWLRGR